MTPGASCIHFMLNVRLAESLYFKKFVFKNLPLAASLLSYLNSQNKTKIWINSKLVYQTIKKIYFQGPFNLKNKSFKTSAMRARASKLDDFLGIELLKK